MPDCYTHTLLGTRALMRCGQTVANWPAFIAGANGPDVLYADRFWRRGKKKNLPALAKRIHTENTGVFLAALVQLAMTPAQQSYALGFLSHYAADCIVHPFVKAMCAPGAPYHGPKGKLRMQASLDSTLYYQDYKTYLVPLHAGSPVLISDSLAQVSSLLHEALLRAYAVDVPVVTLSDAFHHNLQMHKWLISRTGIKKVFVPLLGTVLRGGNQRKEIQSRMQPAPPLKTLPQRWQNLYTNQWAEQTLEELLLEAQEASAVCIAGAMRFWLGKINAAQLAFVLGDNNYYTGMPNFVASAEEEPAGKSLPAPPPAPQQGAPPAKSVYTSPRP